ncbi:hypothetical protein ABE504_16205 [Paenibacillus oryzisoli]|uniref:hypothetical protein n=1 Tax=Paenibacillus oryzisoli TaxID=1850517 RepID=UPI003D2AD4FF
MKRILMFILILSIGIIVSIQSANASKPNITIDDVKGKMPFEVLVPQISDKDWKLIVNPYSKNSENDPQVLGIHYVKNEDIMLSILESNSLVDGIGGIESDEAMIVDINGNKGYFAKWASPAKDQEGGSLVWIQGNTICRMVAFKLDEVEMIKYAKSMRSINR